MRSVLTRATVLGLAATASAQARIVVNQRIGPVKLSLLAVKFYDTEEPRVAWSVTTKSAEQRTGSGLGVGSPLDRVRRKLTGERSHV